jgi:hypothetical protein
MLSDLPSSDVYFFVVYETHLGGNESYMNALGGYRCGDTTMVIYRDAGDGAFPPVDGIGKLMLAQGGLLMGVRNDTEYLTDDDGTTFATLPEGKQFRMGGKVWTKLSMDELRELVHDKSLVVI